MHDPRVGRFFAVDPLTKEYPHYTPYSFSGNKVIAHVELEGLEEIYYNFNKSDKKLRAAFDLFYLEKHLMKYGFDQWLLADYIWPLAINDMVLV